MLSVASRSHPEAVRQAAIYNSKALFGEVGDVFVATLSRDDGEYRVERIPAERARQACEAAMERIGEIGKMVMRDRLPEPEYKAGDARCQSCPYRSLCGNAEAESQGGEGALTLPDKFDRLLRQGASASGAPDLDEFPFAAD